MQKTALITGAAGGIGRATVNLFVDAGWQVLAVDRSPADGFPNGVIFEEVDVSKPEVVQKMFDRFGQRSQRLQALINNAAIQITKPLLEMEVEEWDDVMATNLRSIFLTARCGFPPIKAAEGAIVNISSVHARATSPNISAYAASKGGVVALTRAMAIEFAPHNVRVNAVLPGAVDTPMLRSGFDPDGQATKDLLGELARRTVMGRIGKPAEIAEAILFLADPRQSSFITGQTLTVDGGATVRLSTELA